MGVVKIFGGVNTANPAPCPDTFLPDEYYVTSAQSHIKCFRRSVLLFHPAAIVLWTPWNQYLHWSQWPPCLVLRQIPHDCFATFKMPLQPFPSSRMSY